ncbi:MAG: hypothetical protein U1D30_23980 [Planctomycetota bacterium]
MSVAHEIVPYSGVNGTMETKQAIANWIEDGESVYPRDRRSERERTSRQRRARVRALLARHLPWIEGYPLRIISTSAGARGIEWEYLPRIEQPHIRRLLLGPEELRLAMAGWIKVTTQFPKALSKVVTDVGAWRRGVEFLFTVLDSWIHDERLANLATPCWRWSKPADRELADRLAGRPLFQVTLDRLRWVHLTSPASLTSALRFLNYLADGLEHEGILSADHLIRIWFLARRLGNKKDWHILRELTVATSSEWPIKQGPEVVGAIRSHLLRIASHRHGAGSSYPPWPSILFDQDQVSSDAKKRLDGLLSRPEAQFRRSVHAARLLLHPDLCSAWRSWWTTLREKVEIVRSTLAFDTSMKRGLVARKARADFASFATTAPYSVSLQKFRQFLSGDVAKLEERHIGFAAEALDYLFGKDCSFHRYRALDNLLMKKIPFETMARQIRQTLPSDPRERDDFLAVVRNPNIFDPELFDWSRNSKVFSAVARILKDLKNHPPLPWSAPLRYALRGIALLGADFDLAVSRLRAVSNVPLADRMLGPSSYKLAEELTDNPDDFARVLVSMGQWTYRQRQQIRELLRTLLKAGWRRLAFQVLLDKRSVLSDLNERLQFLKRNNIQVDPPISRKVRSERPEAVYILFVSAGIHGSASFDPMPMRGRYASNSRTDVNSRYPAPLHRVMMQFEGAIEDLDRRVDKVLGPTFPDPEKLDAEIDFLTKEVAVNPRPSLQKRMAMLRARLGSQPRPSDARIEGLTRKLEESLETAVFERWRRDVEAAQSKVFLDLFELDAIREGMLSTDFTAILNSFHDCMDRTRSIGFEILKRRLRQQPSLKGSHERNRSFLARLRDHGIDVDPWLDSSTLATIKLEHNKRVTLRFDDDPLLVFRMGAYFATCLSPGGVNFFSTVANAADINKRVLFAFDETNQVVARTLVAITDDGRLLRFHPYSHLETLHFDELSAGIVNDLARRMGTEVANQGRVQCIVAHRWYDDGADECARLPAIFEKRGPFRESLAVLSPVEFLAELDSQLGTVGMRRWMGHLLDMPEMGERPELLRALFAWSRTWKSIPADTACHLSRVCLERGLEEEAAHLLKRHGTEYLAKCLRNYREPAKSLVEFVLKHSPGMIVRAWHRSRDSSVRVPMDETGDHRELLARAYAALGRLRLAGELAKCPKTG